MHNLQTYALLIGTIMITVLATTLRTVSTISSVATTRPFGSISKGKYNASTLSSSYINGSTLANLPLNHSSSAALPVTDAEMTEDSNNRGPRAPVIFSASSIIGYGGIYGGYEVWLDLELVYLIFKAFHNTPYPISDGEIAGDLPTCGKFTWQKSTFVPYCVESVASSAMSVSDLTSRWNLTRDRHPPILPGQRAAFARMMDYVTAKGIFPGEIPAVIETLVEGLLAGCERMFLKGPSLTYDTLKYFIGGVNDVICTVASTPTTSSACPTLTVTYPNAIPTPYTTTARVPAGDTRCRPYNPKVTYQSAGLCSAGSEWEGCLADASSNQASFGRRTGPLAPALDMAGAFEGLGAMKPLYPVIQPMTTTKASPTTKYTTKYQSITLSPWCKYISTDAGGMEYGGDLIGVGYCTCGGGAAEGGYTQTVGTLCTAACTSVPTLCTTETITQVLTVA